MSSTSSGQTSDCIARYCSRLFLFSKVTASYAVCLVYGGLGALHCSYSRRPSSCGISWNSYGAKAEEAQLILLLIFQPCQSSTTQQVHLPSICRRRDYFVFFLSPSFVLQGRTGKPHYTLSQTSNTTVRNIRIVAYTQMRWLRFHLRLPTMASPHHPPFLNPLVKT